ncbi:MAG: urease accessory protein UreE [Pseudorhodoplanes sp.]|nr:urease accessory protein UreE [Pseudorhodoplanes sp.]
MHRVSSISPAGHWTAPAIDRVILDADERNRRRIVLTGEQGTRVLLDFEKPVTLRDGDGLVLEDGSIVQVCGQPEQLIEITPSSPQDFVRLAWHLGNRHTDVQIVGQRIRIRHDHVLEEMLKGLGASLAPLQAPFDPEGGAGHEHGHDHAHGHHHGQHHHHD